MKHPLLTIRDAAVARGDAYTEALVEIATGGVVSEAAYYGRRGRLVGYWAYGDWDPSLPYRG